MQSALLLLIIWPKRPALALLMSSAGRPAKSATSADFVVAWKFSSIPLSVARLSPWFCAAAATAVGALGGAHVGEGAAGSICRVAVGSVLTKATAVVGSIFT